MELKVSSLSILFICLTLILAVAITVFLFFFFKKRVNGKPFAFFTGCVTFFLFAFVLEKIFQLPFVLVPVLKQLIVNPVYMGIIGGLYAGIFEETGRFCAFKTVLKKYKDDDRTCLMYGAGHASIEVLLLIGIGMITNLAMAMLVNSGNTQALFNGATEETEVQVMATIQTLVSTNPAMFLLSIVERIPAIALHISLSVLVWFACKEKKSLYLYPLAIFLHALVDCVSGIMSGYGVNLFIIEGMLYFFGVALILIAWFTWKSKVCKNKEVSEAV